jgi:MFS family permease
MARTSANASSSHGLIPSLPRPVWKLVSLHGLASLGAGIVFAFLTVYLHFVRGISLSDAGIAFAALPVGAMATGPVAGALADRLGPRYVIAGGGLLAAAAAAVLPFVTVAWQAVGVALVLGAGMTCLESPVYTLLATSVSKEQRSAVFALDYAVIALGWGAGGFVGGFVVNIGRVATFQSAFFIATGCFLVFAAAMATTTPPPASTLDDLPADPTPEITGAGGYRSVVANLCMRRIMSLSVLLMAFGYVQFDVTFPAVAIGSAHVGTRVIGIAFFANMLTVAGGQLFVLRYLQGRRRTRAMVFMCLFPAGCWLLVLGSIHVGGGLPAAMGLVLSFVVVGFGEMTWSPSVPGMVNDLAPAAVRGRYNAANSFAEAIGRLAGPIMAGFMLEAKLADPWLIIIAVMSVAGIPIVFDLERRVPDGANRIGRGDEVPELPGAKL